VDNCIIDPDDCPTPKDLSCLADAVYKKTGRQDLLVDELAQHYCFKTASPNDGHFLAAALLIEGAIVSVLTLNFDLALTTALAHLRAGSTVGIIEGPNDFRKQVAFNLYYLHRNANAPDPEDWVLRTDVLKSNWKNGWERVVAGKVLATPVAVFVGLGSSAAVLTESVKMIRKTIPNGSLVYQVDPGEFGDSEFSKDLDIQPGEFIQRGWCDFMSELSDRLLLAQTRSLIESARALVERERLVAEDIDHVVERIKRMGLLGFGTLRANWLLADRRYSADEPASREFVADLLLAAATVARVTGTTAFPFDDGIVEFRRGDQIVDCRIFVSGNGTHGCLAVEGKLSARARGFRNHATPPLGVVVSHTRDHGIRPVAAPQDLIDGEITPTIIGQSALPMTHVEAIRRTALEGGRVAR
jgi:hypothetical protein